MTLRSNYVFPLDLKKARVDVNAETHRQLANGIRNLEIAIA